jgi:dTDP-4-dehydrorhamnose 3,5-epimerase
MPAPSFRTGIIADVLVKSLERWSDPRGWLCEMFRRDELPANFDPAMGYMSMTEPGVLRGPHEHRRQTDYFCFLGPSRFRFYLWDNRPDSKTFGIYQEELVGTRQPTCLLVPPGVVHAYRNEGRTRGLVLNFPDQLYRGPGKQHPVDEIRHEDDPFSPFKIDAQPSRRRKNTPARRRRHH